MLHTHRIKERFSLEAVMAAWAAVVKEISRS